MPGPVSSASSRLRRRDADDELGRVAAAGEVDEGLRDVVADDLVVGAAQLLDQGALHGEGFGIGFAQAVLARDVHGEQLAAG